MNVKDKLTGELINKELALYVIPKGKKTKLYFKDKINMDNYMEKLYIKEEDKSYWNLMNDLIIELLFPKKDMDKVSSRVWQYFNKLRKEVDAKFCVFILHYLKPKILSFYNSPINPDLQFRENYLIKLVRENKDYYLGEYVKIIVPVSEEVVYSGTITNATAKDTTNKLIEGWF